MRLCHNYTSSLRVRRGQSLPRTPIRGGNPPWRIASVVTLSRKDITTQALMPCDIRLLRNRKKFMALLWINNISVSFGGPQLLDGASLQIEAGERIGLLGRNGSGKSTLMKLLHQDIVPDKGEIVSGGEVRVALMPQDIEDLPGTVYDVVASGGQQHLDLLREYHDLTVQL